MKKNIYNILKAPVVTEKGTALRDKNNQYIFEVEKCANKYEIKNAVEKIFKVSVNAVNVINMRGKVKRMGKNFGKRPNFKKAVVTLSEGQKIELYEGV